MKVLVACECSGMIRSAFEKRGHYAWSCDLKPCEDEVEKVAAALSQAYADALERAAKVADAEAELYKQNARKCDAAKNYAGGMHDTCGALACLRVRDAIRSLPLEPQPLETKGTDNG